ncbi:MAG: response regulator [Planctomycetota bacterium]
MITQAPRLFRILLVDDHEDDLELVRRAVERCGCSGLELVTANDGLDAIEKLESLKLEDRLPDLLLVDLNMPRLDGRGLLRHVRAQELIAPLPVLMLSTSDQPTDIVACYRDGCNAYFKKPLEFRDLVALVEGIFIHWTDLVHLPNG